MKKIISLFQRNYDGDRKVRDEIVPGAEWVPAGEGIATRKWNGTACLWKDGKLWKRYDAKHGKTPPEGFLPAQSEPDAVTGHWPGWLPVGLGKEDAWHREALAVPLQEGATYELCGPKVQGNAEHFSVHWLIKHGAAVLSPCPRAYDALRNYLQVAEIEGIVWWHPDGRMVKIKAKDFPSQYDVS